MLSIGEMAVLKAASNLSTRTLVAGTAVEMVGDSHFDEPRALAVLDRLLCAGMLRKDGNGFEITRRGVEAIHFSVEKVRDLLPLLRVA